MIGLGRERERFEEFLGAWAELAEAAALPGTVVVVEGEKDRRALSRLGLEATITLVHRGQRLPVIAHALAQRADRAVVLTDWDRKGGQLAERLAGLLGGADVKVDLETRQRLGRLLRGELVHVEGLYRWALHLAESVGVVLPSALEEIAG